MSKSSYKHTLLLLCSSEKSNIAVSEVVKLGNTVLLDAYEPNYKSITKEEGETYFGEQHARVFHNL